MLTKHFKTDLLKLGDLEKFEAIELLSSSLDRPDPEIEDMIARESERRFKAYKAGKIKAKPLSTVLRAYS